MITRPLAHSHHYRGRRDVEQAVLHFERTVDCELSGGDVENAFDWFLTTLTRDYGAAFADAVADAYYDANPPVSATCPHW